MTNPIDFIKSLKPWQLKEANKLLDRLEREQMREKPGETIFEKVKRLKLKVDRTGSATAAFDLVIAWCEAERVGLAHVPTLDEQLDGAKPYWLGQLIRCECGHEGYINAPLDKPVRLVCSACGARDTIGPQGDDARRQPDPPRLEALASEQA